MNDKSLPRGSAMRLKVIMVGALIVATGIRAGGAVAQSVEQWTVNSRPTVSIGTLDGPDGEMLVNPLMATVFSDGSIALRNSTRGTFEIRYFDGSGSYIHTASRWGEGPFEFQTAIGVHRLPGDSVLVVGQDGRVAVFGPRGERVREGRIGLRPLFPLLVSYLVDGTHLALVKPQNPGKTEPGTRRSTTILLLFNFDTRHADTLGTVLGRRTDYEPMGRGLAIIPTPFGPETFVATGGGMVWTGDNENPTIRGYRTDRSNAEIEIRSPFEARRVSRSDRERMQEAYSKTYSGDTQNWGARYARSMDFPQEMPWFGPLEVDRLGNLWVQEYEPFGVEGDQHWAVFSQDGQHVADATVPPSAVPPCARGVTRSCDDLTGIFEIGADYMLVPQSDEWGVRYVREFRIRKPLEGVSRQRER